MATERTVHREVREETVDTAPESVVKEKEIEVREVPVAVPVAVPTAPAEPGVTNVNVTPGAPAPGTGTGGNVSINTPDGTQVNVNS